MTAILDRAVARARKLRPEQQDALGTLLLEEIEADGAWDDRLAASQELLARLADRALAEVARGEVRDGDPSELA